MTTTIARIFVLPIVAAGIFAGAVLGMSGMAHAQSLGGQEPSGSGNFFSPQTYADPAPTVMPGWYHNHGPAYITYLTGGDEA
ncbi:hypothetical protein [Mycolicibacterium sp. YH-1]|uniref:hypothetical protein n=1 Tax=Mycolicibacterium sp. YH-1 TaxID=2908837 RepID=UPI001F4C44BE|nr:hypothetical protein [Mycolicibacterium sp. YH-1]UNB51171.1 hypothetical protein L0M16_25035 [Mycolicibacterium sp. YH-1]